MAPGAGTARGAYDFACSAAGSFAQQFWSWRPASFCHALAEAAYLHDTKNQAKNLGWLVPAGATCDWARGLDGVFHLIFIRPTAGWKGVAAAVRGLSSRWLGPPCPRFTPTTGYNSTSHESVRLVRRHRFSSGKYSR